jgi:DNA end-binding protein Ku
VALYTATERSSEVHFNFINPKTNNRIHMQAVDAGTGRAVDRSDLVKGFAVSKNKYVVLDDEELDAVKLESTRIIDIESFVDADTIDRIYWDQPYYLAPQGKTGIEAFAVVQAAMARKEKIALGRLVLHQREHICALEPRDSGILLTTLRSHDEIRDSGAIFDRHLPKPNAGMLQIAERLIAQQQAKFDPGKFKDRYEDALRELIARKKKGEPVVSVEEPEEEKVVDLMDALRHSLKGGGSRARAERFLAAHDRKKTRRRSSSHKRPAPHKRAA